MTQEQQDFFAHFTEKISQELVDYVTNNVFRYSRYIFVWREKKTQWGHCTHCHQTVVVAEGEGYLRHNATWKCPVCESEVTVKSSGISRKYMVDEAYLVWYEKSLVNPKAITMRGIHLKRDYRGDFNCVETVFRVESMYLFAPGHSEQWFQTWQGKWYKSEKIFSECSGNGFNYNHSMYRVPLHVPEECIARAVKGTPFQYSTWKTYFDGDMVRFFDLFTKYPCIEYLTKTGFKEVVRAKLNGWKTYGVINWRAKSLPAVLRMTKHDLKNLRASNHQFLDTYLLYLIQTAKKDGSKLSMDELKRIWADLPEMYERDLRKALQKATLQKLYAYFNKQQKRIEFLTSVSAVLLMWNDYIRDCVELGFDLSVETVLFPSNLHLAHEITTRQVNVKKNEKSIAGFNARSKALEKLSFAAQGFFVRPVASQEELITEGKTLKHCVGGYADSHVKGQCGILLLRKVDDPDTPFYTIEIRGTMIAQCYGYKNCAPTPEVAAFIKSFTAEKLTKKETARIESVELEVAV